MIEILKKELKEYPPLKGGKYPEELHGKLFKIFAINNLSYCEKSGTTIWGIPDELLKRIKELSTNAQKAQSQAQLQPQEEKLSVEDLVALTEAFEFTNILQLRKEGLI